jgi:hypothetical protein
MIVREGREAAIEVEYVGSLSLADGSNLDAVVRMPL